MTTIRGWDSIRSTSTGLRHASACAPTLTHIGGPLLTPWVVALPFGIRLLRCLLVLRMLALVGFVPFMADAFQLHFVGCLELGQILGITCGRVVVVELMLQVKGSYLRALGCSITNWCFAGTQTQRTASILEDTICKGRPGSTLAPLVWCGDLGKTVDSLMQHLLQIGGALGHTPTAAPRSLTPADQKISVSCSRLAPGVKHDLQQLQGQSDTQGKRTLE